MVQIHDIHRAVLQELRCGALERRDIPSITMGDVDAGNLLGSGSFSNVYEVRLVTPLTRPDPSHHIEEKSDKNEAIRSRYHTPRDHNYRYCTRSKNTIESGPKYALKTLRGTAVTDTVIQQAVIRDALFEAELLLHLPPHENVVNLIAVSDVFWEDPSRGFLILEKVTETLVHRLARWSNRQPSNLPRVFQSRKHRRAMLQNQCTRIVSCAAGIAQALKFLHTKHIIYRDVKPANIGFGYDGQAKLFDFGLARTLGSQGSLTRRLTPHTGTVRYMAPEVMFHRDYSFPADVHSFATLLWEICTLRRPHANCTTIEQLLKTMARCQKQKPSQREVASPVIRQLLEMCWDADPRVRPTMALVVNQIALIEKESLEM